MYYSHSFFIYPPQFYKGLIINNLNTVLNFFFYNSTPPFGRPGGGKRVAGGARGSGAGRLSQGAILVRVVRLRSFARGGPAGRVRGVAWFAGGNPLLRALAGRVRDAFRGTRGQPFGTAVCVP